MSDTVAYALKADLEGTVTLAGEDGEPREVPKFLGGLYRVGDRDLELREALDDEGELGYGPAGVIVVDAMDTEARTVLDAIAVLKSAPAPDVEVSRWDADGATKRVLDDEARRRGITGFAGATRANVADALHVDDRIIAGELELPDGPRQARAAGELSVKGLLEAAAAIDQQED